MDPAALSALYHQLYNIPIHPYYYSPSSPYGTRYPDSTGTRGGTTEDEAAALSSPGSSASAVTAGSRARDVASSAVPPTAYSGYWALPPSALARDDRLSPSVALRSSTNGGLGLLGGSSSSSGFGDSGGGKVTNKKNLGMLSQIFSFDNALVSLTLLGFSLFLIIFYVNALRQNGRKRRRTSEDGIELLEANGDVSSLQETLLDIQASNGLFDILFDPAALAEWYKNDLPQFLGSFGTTLKRLANSIYQAVELTALDIVGTARGVGNAPEDEYGSKIT